MLKRIKLENFKSIKYLDLRCTQLNLLAGLNGSGKSSFIQFLIFLWHYAEKGIGPYLHCTYGELGLPGRFSDIEYAYAKENDLVQFHVDFEAKNCSHEGEAQRCSLDRVICQDFESHEEDDIVVGDIDSIRHELPFEKRFAVAHYSNSSHIQSPPTDSKPWSERLLESVNARVSSDKLIQNAFHSVWGNARLVDAFRKEPTEDCVGSGKYGAKENATKPWGSFNPEGDDVLEYLYKFGQIIKFDQDNPMVFPGSELHDIDEEELMQKDNSGEYFMFDHMKYEFEDRTQRKFSTLSEQVNAWLGVVSPGVRLNISRQLAGDKELFHETVLFGENKHAKGFRPQNVGFGISYVLPVLATVLTARPTDIIMIENPEAHLHPKGQSAMGKLLARAAAYGVQLFVETHSDHVINGIRVAVKQGILKPDDVNISFFDRRKHKVRYPDGVREEYYADIHSILIDRNGMLSNYPKGFLDEWDNQYYQLNK